MCDEKIESRLSSLIIEDLKYDPETKSGPMSSGRAFVLCELVIYRFRDMRFDTESPEYAMLTALAEEIEELRLSWKGKSK